jgi:hypothetical protein
MTPNLSTTEDIKVIADLLAQTSVIREIEAALHTLQSAKWGNTDISGALYEQGEIILQRCGEVANTCWYDMSGYKVIYDHHRDRARRICHFIEWFYYRLTVSQRRKLKNWPSADVAHALARGELVPDMIVGNDTLKRWVSEIDLVLATSIIVKLNHVRLGPGDSCYLCLVDRSLPNPATDIKKRLWSMKGPDPDLPSIERLGRNRSIHNMLAACIFSDVDCLRHYFKPENDKLVELMDKSIDDYRSLINRWRSALDVEYYHKDLKILLNKFWDAADEHDPRAKWLDHVDLYLTNDAGE